MSNVAVIMSVYKNDDLCYLKESVNSILGQSYLCDFFIYVDGDIPSEMSEYLDSIHQHKNVQLFCNHINNGLAYALNELINLTKSYEYIARMDSDDISYSDRISKQVAFMDSNPKVDVMGAACREFGADFALEKKSLPTGHRDLLNFSITRCPFVHPTVMFRKRVFECDNMRYPINTTLTEDMAFWLLLLERGYYFSNIDEVLLDYRLTESTIDRRKGVFKAISEITIRMKYMFLLKKVTIKNISMLSFRLFFHLMPSRVVKFSYKHFR